MRQLVEAHYTPILRDAGLIDRVCVTAHELLENAAKYGGTGLSSLEVEIVPGPEALQIQIAVSNPLNAQKLAELQRFMDEMNSARDPFDFYQRRMTCAATRKDGGSGLGLARISFEAEMALSMALDARRVRMIAVAPIEGTEAIT